MPSFATGTVTALLSERAGLQRVGVDVDGLIRRAYVLTGLIGPVAVGDTVVLNTTAVDLGLGTGGWDVVHWNLARARWSALGGGHVMKLRYTSLQVDTGVAEEADDYEEPAGGLRGLPVIVCGLHSQVAGVAAVFKARAPGRRLFYVMSDAGALPLALSNLVADLRRTGLLDAAITAGQAFGGDEEAVNVASALRVALAAGADAVVVASGPGGVGTATRRGFGALEAAATVDTAGRDGGRPIVALRWSGVDARARHHGVSHHTTAVLECCHQPATVGLPAGWPVVEIPSPHVGVKVDDAGTAGLLADAGVAPTTMGHCPEDDPGFYAFAGAAGTVAAQLLAGSGQTRR